MLFYETAYNSSSEPDHVVRDFALKTFFIFLVFTPKFEDKIRTEAV